MDDLMKSIAKDNLTTFMDYYHGFHDSYVFDVLYDFNNCQVELFINVFWSGEPTLKNDGTYETNKKKIRMICHEVHQYKYKEVYSDYIDDAYLKYIKLGREEYLCFATDQEDPLISVVCKKIEYEEIN